MTGGRQLRRLLLDIETTGNNPLEDEVIAIGVDDLRRPIVYTGKEREILASAAKTMEKADTIIGWRIEDFDLPFLQTRCIKHRIQFHVRGEVVDLSRLPRGVAKGYSAGEWYEFIGIAYNRSLRGKHAPGLHRAGRSDLVKTHCLDDLKALRGLYNAFRRVFHL